MDIRLDPGGIDRFMVVSKRPGEDKNHELFVTRGAAETFLKIRKKQGAEAAIIRVHVEELK